MWLNQGGMPGMAHGKRIHAVLRNGTHTRLKSPAGWPANGPGSCRWTLINSPFDIIEWEFAE